MSKNQFPQGWDGQRVQAVLDHYENQTDDEVADELEAAFSEMGQRTLMEVPAALVPVFRQLIAKHEKDGVAR